MDRKHHAPLLSSIDLLRRATRKSKQKSGKTKKKSSISEIQAKYLNPGNPKIKIAKSKQ
jgi:hypothetical protein